MQLVIRPANPGNAKPLIGLYGEGKVGKTTSAALLARGFVGDTGRIIMIETEAGRGEVAAKKVPGAFDVISLQSDFSPEIFGEAIAMAEKAKADALIIDSASAEWEGIGGVLDQAEKKRADGAKGVLVWQQPKISHARHFMLRLLQTPIPLVIVNMRGKYAMEEVVVNGRKDWARSKDLQPIQSDGILFDLFFCAWLDREHRVHIWGTNDDTLREVIPEGSIISIQTGRQLRAWSAGGAAANPPRAEPAAGMTTPANDPPPEQSGAPFTVRFPNADPKAYDQLADWLSVMAKSMQKIAAADTLEKFWSLNAEERQRIASLDSETATSVQMAHDAAVKRLAKPADGEALL